LTRKLSICCFHKEDNGLIYSSIRNDGMLVFRCEKCLKMWIGKVQPEDQVPEQTLIEARETAETTRKMFMLRMIKEHRRRNSEGV
jgi:hypothetical protein